VASQPLAELNARREGLTEGLGGIDLGAVTAALEREGVESFCDSYNQLLDCIESKLPVVVGGGQ
jgi:hypothetical protein